MRWVRAAALLAALPVALGACGGASGGAGNTGDPVAVANAYVGAVKSDPNGGQQYLVTSEPTEKLTGSTNLSRFLAANKSASAKLVKVSWIPPNGSNPVASESQCLVPAPQGGQVCIVTIEVTGGKPAPVYFHIDLENRYAPGKWEITNIEAVEGKPDNLLPSGNEAHKA